jgi:purine-nucleoside/S-methyl-5'-thioadenosine phosphorylase / adenosine deaminase
LESLVDQELTVGAIRVPGAWTAPGLGHGFFGRTGGVSRNQFASLNLSTRVGDDPEAVAANWRRVRPVMPPYRRLALLNQVHGSEVHLIGTDHDGARLIGDGMVTASPGVALGIFTADCVAMLMVDAEQHIVGAFHAGWRGTLAGIARAGLRRMDEAGAEVGRIQVALGPSVGPCCYEVDAELGARFDAAWPCSRARVCPGRPGKAMIDLRGVLTDQLIECGLDPAAIAAVGPCTRCASERFFSRRAAHGQVGGLQLSFVGFVDGAGR